ncbi:MAG: DUF4832 domain-containing protein [Paludibacteraceae bacterium]|nr:DUF4832 domain-containing protein [Paludibacteraceae bacterium]
MKRLLPLTLCVVLFAACNTNPPEPKGTTVTFTETDELFPNPERGLFSQSYFTSADLTSHANATVINSLRSSANYLTLYLHSYYLTDYMESDIPQEFLDRLETNMNALREGGGKVVLRFSYKFSMDTKDKPFNATPEWIHKHMDQVAPYIQKHADVIYCVQCGWLGSWGEWYYTDNGYRMNATKQEDLEMRWEVLEHMLRVVPEDRQVGLRIPAYKRNYLKMRGDSLSTPLTAEEAHKPTAKARICGHNDCFVSSSNDVGTYSGAQDRDFWAEDSKYTIMGGETCEKAYQSNGENALSEMKKFHWSYLNRDYRESVTGMWRSDGTMDIILHRIGYRLALDKIIVTPKPAVGQKLDVYCVLHNSGFAAPMNPRDVELILVNANDPTKKFVYQQDVDPRFWLPEEEHRFTLTCTPEQAGQYKVYLNLPDPYESLHNDPRYSIRLANENCWDETTGYNYLTTVTVE